MIDALGSFRTAGLLGVLLLWGLGGSALAQSNGAGSTSLGIQDAPLGQALEQAAAAAGISLVYDASLVNDRRASCIAQDAAPEALLRCLLDEHPIDYVQTSKGTYVLRPAIRRPPQRGQLAGLVRGSEEGRPLPNAHVRLPEAEQFAGTVTDSTGHFRVSGLLPGPHTVVVSHLGYNRHEATVYVPPNGTARHEATLAPTSIVADSLVIDADRYGVASAQSDADRVPTGTLRDGQAAEGPDVLDAASTVLGVTASPPYADLHIQGAPTGGHTLHLDGVPVRNPASAGRLLGAFSPLALDGLTARKAGFGVLHGNALSGTLDLDHDLSGGSRYGTVRADPRSLNARLQGTTTLGETPVSAMVAGRVSVWDVYQDVGLTDLIDRWSTLDPVLAAAQVPSDTSLIGGSLGARTQPNAGFYDLHGAARFDLGPAEQLYASAYHGGSHLGADLVLGQNVRTAPNDFGDDETTLDTSTFSLPTHDEYAWSNTIAQVRYDTPVTSRTTSTLQASVSHYQGVTDSEVEELQSARQSATPTMAAAQWAAYGQEGANEITEIDLESRFNLSLARNWGLIWSVGATYQTTRFRIGNAFAPRLHHQTRTGRLTTAAETTIGLGAHTQLEGGLRLTTLPAQSAVFAEPRGAFRYDQSVDGLGTLGFSIRGGLYRQFTTQFDLNRDGATAVVPTTRMWLPITSPLTPPRTYHLAADLTWQPSSRWQVELEGYRKWEPHLLAVDYSRLRDRPEDPVGRSNPAHFVAPSRGSAYGGGLHVTYDGSFLTSSVRYAYSRARRTFPGRFDGRLTPVPWSEPHRLTVNAEVPLGGGVAFETTGEGVWERPWGYRRAYYAYLTPSNLGEAWDRLQMDRPEAHVLPPRYRLDVGLTVSHSWAGVDVKGRLGIANVLDRQNVADWALEPQGGGSVSQWTRPLPGRRATVSIRIRY